MRRGQKLPLLLALAVASTSVWVSAQETPVEVPTLSGFIVLPADTFAEGPAAGAFISPTANTHGRTVPFESQPVQGFSALIPAPTEGHWFGMSDNGFGGRDNSGDYHLRVYELRLDFEAQSFEIVDFIQLSDPNRLVPFPIRNEDTPERILTGGDFDLESMQIAADGTLWFGEEFGPFIFQTDANGVLLQAPISTPYPALLSEFARDLPFVQSPDHPDFADIESVDDRRARANLPGSRGFEGMAISPDGTTLYPILEGALAGDAVPTRLLMQEFSLADNAYTGEFWFYPMNVAGHALGELTAINDREFLVIERDGNQGENAAFKRVYRVSLDDVQEDGHTLNKTLVVDLLALHDPNGLTQPEPGVVGFGPVFKFPFVTIEAVWPADERTLILVNDNNFPFSSGRRPGVEPDDSEFIRITLPEPLPLALGR